MCRPRGERPAGLPPCRARAQPGYQVFAGFLETLVFSNYYGNTFCFVLFLKFLMDAGTATLLHFVPSDNIGEQKGPSTGLCCSSPGARGSEVSGDTRGCPGVQGLERRAVLPAAGARGRRGVRLALEHGIAARCRTRSCPRRPGWTQLCRGSFPVRTGAHGSDGCWATCRLGLGTADRHPQSCSSAPAVRAQSCAEVTAQTGNAAAVVSPRPKLENRSPWNKSMKLDT